MDPKEFDVAPNDFIVVNCAGGIRKKFVVKRSSVEPYYVFQDADAK
jgi:hypothetical protein